MPTLTLTLGTLGLLCLLIDVALQLHRQSMTRAATLPAWRDLDVTTRQGSLVDRVYDRREPPALLAAWADQCRELEMHRPARLLMDLALALDVAERVEARRREAERQTRQVRVQLRGVGA